jgi:uncharacterized membrane protein
VDKEYYSRTEEYSLIIMLIWFSSFRAPTKLPDKCGFIFSRACWHVCCITLWYIYFDLTNTNRGSAMKVSFRMTVTLILLSSLLYACNSSGVGTAANSGPLKPVAGKLQIPVGAVNDGKAHHYQVKADDGTMVTFFVIKSRDGIIRAALDACDVCYKAGKGYYQDGDFMVCVNCGQRFASNRINVVKGGCNPAPLNRVISGDNLVITMNDINANRWYMRYRI